MKYRTSNSNCESEFNLWRNLGFDDLFNCDNKIIIEYKPNNKRIFMNKLNTLFIISVKNVNILPPNAVFATIDTRNQYQLKSTINMPKRD